MNITILSVGTRGDIQPLVALGKQLELNGANILFSTHLQYEKLVLNNGLKFAEMPRNPIHVWENSKKTNNERISLWQQIEPDMTAWLETGLKLCQNSDAIIYNNLYSVGQHLGEALKIPFFQVMFEPSIPTRAFPTAFFPIQKNMGAFFNKLTYFVGSQLFWRQIKSELNQFRKLKLDLEPINWRGPLNRLIKNRNYIICCFSSCLVKKPKDWNSNIKIAGYWYLTLKEKYQASDLLINFLGKGNKPIFFDFGSFAHDLMEQKIKYIIDDLHMSGQRLIIAPGQINLENYTLPKETYLLNEEVPHEWLLPKVKAIISHGGVGVVHAAIKAGIPTIPISIFAAQHFWGKKLFDNGLSSMPLKIRGLEKGDILKSIKYLEINDEIITKNLEKVKKDVSSENGTENITKFILKEIQAKNIHN